MEAIATLPIDGDVYFRAFGDSVALLAAGYDYGADWASSPVVLSSTGSSSSFAAHGYGVPVQKTPAIIKELTGVSITQSAITQNALRCSQTPEVQEAYKELRDAIKASPVAQTDDTGFRVNGKPAQLMVFATPDTSESAGVTVYQIREQHRNEEVREVIPDTYQGTMVTDRGRAYDAEEFDGVKQQKCIFHVERSIDAVVETKTGAARKFGEQLIDYLNKSLLLWQDWHDGKKSGFEKKAKRLQRLVDNHLRPRTLKDQDNQRLLNEIGWHNDRGNLLRFLEDPSIPPTNNLSERELRPAIQARKVSHCSKNDRGARAHEVLSSIVRTQQRKRPFSLVAAFKRIVFGDPQPHPT